MRRQKRCEAQNEKMKQGWKGGKKNCEENDKNEYDVAKLERILKVHEEEVDTDQPCKKSDVEDSVEMSISLESY